MRGKNSIAHEKLKDELKKTTANRLGEQSKRKHYRKSAKI